MKEILDGEIEDSEDEQQTVYVPGTNLTSLNHQKQELANKRRLIVIDYIRFGIRNQLEIVKKLKEEHGIEVSQATISQDLKQLDQEYKIRVANRVDAERAIDFDRLEVAIGVLMDKLINDKLASNDPDLNLIRTLVPLLERKAKMLGYDSPLKIDMREIIIQRAIAAGIDPELALEAAEALKENIN